MMLYKTLRVLVLVIPVIILLVHVYREDRNDNESILFMLKLFIYGIGACHIAYYAEMYGCKFLCEKWGWVETTEGFKLVKTFVLVAFVEEFLKMFFLYIGTWKHKQFNYRFDAIIFAVSTSLGFALAENVIYVLNYGLKVGFARGITTVPMHAAVAIILGVNYGMAKECYKQGDKFGKAFLIFVGFMIAFLVHGIYDYCIVLGTKEAYITLGGLIVLMYVIAIVLVKRFAIEDKKIS